MSQSEIQTERRKIDLHLNRQSTGSEEINTCEFFPFLAHYQVLIICEFTIILLKCLDNIKDLECTDSTVYQFSSVWSLSRVQLFANLSYANLIIRPAQEPRKKEKVFFLYTTPSTRFCQKSELQNCERIHFCWSKPPSLLQTQDTIQSGSHQHFSALDLLPSCHCLLRFLPLSS